MQHARAVAGAAHGGVGDAEHVTHALLQQLFWNGQHSPFGHAGRADGTGILQHDDAVGGDIEGGVVVDARGEVVVIAEDDRRAAVAKEARLHRGVFDDGTARAKISAQDGGAAFGRERVFERAEDFAVEDFRAREVFAKGAAVHGERVV